jgi:hypothetical protein
MTIEEDYLALRSAYYELKRVALITCDRLEGRNVPASAEMVERLRRAAEGYL